MARRLTEREVSGRQDGELYDTKRAFACGCGGGSTPTAKQPIVFPELMMENLRLILLKQGIIHDWIKKALEQAKEEYDRDMLGKEQEQK